jgi:hypothetical protein
MPMPKPNKNESKKAFLSRCMSDSIMNKEYPDTNQRYAVCNQQSRGSLLDQVLQVLFAKFNCACEDEYEEDCDCEEELTLSNLVIPKPEDYIDFGEQTEEYLLDTVGQFKFRHPITNEFFFYDRMGVYTKDGRTLIYVGRAAEYQGRKVTLNKPFRTPDGPKKFAVYTKNDKGKVVIVRFGDPERSIKKHIPERRKNFRARHGCNNPGPKYKAKYWSCEWSW